MTNHSLCIFSPQHLFTCELDGQQVSDVDDCLERLKYLDATGRVWGQDMFLEVRDRALRLLDIESQVNLSGSSFGENV